MLQNSRNFITPMSLVQDLFLLCGVSTSEQNFQCAHHALLTCIEYNGTDTVNEAIQQVCVPLEHVKGLNSYQSSQSKQKAHTIVDSLGMQSASGSPF